MAREESRRLAPAHVGPIAVTSRNLPHWRCDEAVYWITFRLADSLPQSKLVELRAEKESWLLSNPEPWTRAQQLDHEARFGERIQTWLDAGYGGCALARPEARACICGCLLRFNGERLHLHAAVVMPNHVHALIEPRDNARLSDLLKGIKGASARSANRILNQAGAFWMEESYDRIVRNETEYAHFCAYIIENPAKARLAPDQYWLWPGGK